MISTRFRKNNNSISCGNTAITASTISLTLPSSVPNFSLRSSDRAKRRLKVEQKENGQLYLENEEELKFNTDFKRCWIYATNLRKVTFGFFIHYDKLYMILLLIVAFIMVYNKCDEGDFTVFWSVQHVLSLILMFSMGAFAAPEHYFVVLDNGKLHGFEFSKGTTSIGCCKYDGALYYIEPDDMEFIFSAEGQMHEYFHALYYAQCDSGSSLAPDSLMDVLRVFSTIDYSPFKTHCQTFASAILQLFEKHYSMFPSKPFCGRGEHGKDRKHFLVPHQDSFYGPITMVHIFILLRLLTYLIFLPLASLVCDRDWSCSRQGRMDFTTDSYLVFVYLAAMVTLNVHRFVRSLNCCCLNDFAANELTKMERTVAHWLECHRNCLLLKEMPEPSGKPKEDEETSGGASAAPECEEKTEEVGFCVLRCFQGTGWGHWLLYYFSIMVIMQGCMGFYLCPFWIPVVIVNNEGTVAGIVIFILFLLFILCTCVGPVKYTGEYIDFDSSFQNIVWSQIPHTDSQKTQTDSERTVTDSTNSEDESKLDTCNMNDVYFDRDDEAFDAVQVPVLDDETPVEAES